MKNKVMVIIMVLGFGLFGKQVKAQIPEYQVVDLGTLGGSWSSAHGINNSGQVVGQADTSNNTTHAFLYSSGSMQDLGTLEGDSSSAQGINDSGHVVGYIHIPSSDPFEIIMHSFLHTNGSMQDLQIALHGSIYNQAFGINANNQIVGVNNTNIYDPFSGPLHAFLYSDGSVRDLGTLGGRSSSAHGINDNGQVVGQARTSNGVVHAFLYSDGSMQDLGTLGGRSSHANGINNNGQVVGYSYIVDDNDYHAFLYSDGSMQNLGTLGGSVSEAIGINASGQIIGSSATSSGVDHAFIYVNGGMQDLNDLLVPTNSGWILQRANGINDKGQIVGYGINPQGQTCAFLLNPLPLGWRQVIEAQPEEVTYENCPAKESGKDSLVLVTHGWINRAFSPNSPDDPAWVDGISNVISGYLVNHSLNNWQVYGYKWVEGAWKVFPTHALNNAKQKGKVLGDCIAAQGWTNVHLTAYSAGAGLIQVVLERIKVLSPSTTVHCTFLDPYVGKDYEGVSQYGSGADWAENYFTRDSETIISGPLTESLLDHAYNVDITPLDPNKHIGAKFRSSVTGEMEPCIKTFTHHDWPIDFYMNTIVENVTTDYAGFGFPLSKEGGNWDYALANYPTGNASARVLGTSDPTCLTEVQVIPLPWVDTLIDFIQSPTIQSDTGTIQKWFDSIKLFSGSPAWLATVVSSTNPVNVISFDTQFSSTNGAQGLLSVYWDDQVIGSIDERIVSTNRYTFSFPNAAANSGHILGFRLDTFTNIQSVVTVTNIVLNQVGVSQPFSLSLTGSTTNGALVYELTGEAGFEYNVQVSTNLVDWSDIITLANTNGTVRFYDQSSTNSPMRFYRGVAP